MAIFNSYVKLPEGKSPNDLLQPGYTAAAPLIQHPKTMQNGCLIGLGVFPSQHAAANLQI
jgi:hypothetical protein